MRAGWVRGVVVLTALGLASSGCGRSESDTLDAERDEASAATSTGSSESPVPSPVVEELVTVDAAGFPLTVNVPESWEPLTIEDWTVGSGGDATLGLRLPVYPADNPAPESPYAVGVEVSVSDTFLERFDIPTKDFAALAFSWAEFVADIDYTSEDPSCDYGGVSDASVGEAYALLRIWTSCGSGVTTIADVWSADPETGEVVYGFVVVEGAEEVDRAREILGSIARDGQAVVHAER